MNFWMDVFPLLVGVPLGLTLGYLILIAIWHVSGGN